MQTTIGSYDAKTKLSEILRKVEQGESFTITNRGRPIAKIIPFTEGEHSRTESAINNIMEAKSNYLSEAQLNAFKNTGRK